MCGVCVCERERERELMLVFVFVKDSTSSEENEPQSGGDAAPKTSNPSQTKPAVPLGADFGTREREGERERGERERGREGERNV